MKALATLIIVLFGLVACGPDGGSGKRIATDEELKAINDKKRVEKLDKVLSADELRFPALQPGEKEDLESADFQLKKSGDYALTFKLKEAESKSVTGKFARNDDSAKPDLELENLGSAVFMRRMDDNQLCIQLRTKEEVTGRSVLVLCQE